MKAHKENRNERWGWEVEKRGEGGRMGESEAERKGGAEEEGMRESPENTCSPWFWSLWSRNLL